MLKILMIRHGKTYGNTLGRYIGTTDEHLLESETEALLQIQPIPVECVFTSPMIRCLETADLMFPGQTRMVIDGFRECDFGEFENKNYQELSENEAYQQWIDSEGTLGFPGGESMVEFKQRCLAAFDEMIAVCIKEELENVAMVVHGGTIMSILDAYGFPRAEYYAWQVKNAEGYKIRMQLEQWCYGRRELVVDGKIIREM